MYNGSSGRGRGRFHPYDQRNGKTVVKSPYDRHCIECGMLIKGQAIEKPVACPALACRFPQPFRSGWSENGWGHCPKCDAFMNAEHSYCMCGWQNSETIERKKRLLVAETQKREFERQQFVKSLQEHIRKQEAEKMALQKKLEDATMDRIISSLVIPGMQGVHLQVDATKQVAENGVQMIDPDAGSGANPGV